MPEGPRGGEIRLHREDWTCECGKKYKNTLSYLKHHVCCEAFYLPRLRSLVVTGEKKE
jgi:hypothetical protein